MTSQKIAWHLLWEIHEKNSRVVEISYLLSKMTHLILPKSNISGLEMRSFWSSDKDTWNTVSYSLLSVPITVQNSTFPCYLSGKAAGKGCGSKGTKAFLLKTSPAFSRASKIQFSLDITKDLVFFISVSPFSHGNVQTRQHNEPKIAYV